MSGLMESMAKKVRDLLLSILEKEAVKLALKKLLGSATSGGVRAWFIKFIIKNIVFDKAVEPITKAAFIEMNYYYSRHEGRKLIRELKESEDAEEYSRIIDNILNS